MMVNQLEGWVFVGYSDENLLSMVRPGTVRLWDDARTIGKAAGQPVLFLQTQGKAPAWAGSGVVTEVEERWKAFGVYVETRTVLSRLLATVVSNAGGHPTEDTRQVDAIRSQGAAAWENRTLAARIGFGGFRARTPYLEEERDIRLTAADLSVLCQLQPALRALWPP
jgi:hypothetical protein